MHRRELRPRISACRGARSHHVLGAATGMAPSSRALGGVCRAEPQSSSPYTCPITREVPRRISCEGQRGRGERALSGALTRLWAGLRSQVRVRALALRRPGGSFLSPVEGLPASPRSRGEAGKTRAGARWLFRERDFRARTASCRSSG